MEHDRKKLVQDVALSSFSPLAQSIAGFVSLVFIAKYIGVEGYGIWAQLQATLPLIVVFVCLNLGHAMSRFYTGEQDTYELARGFSAILAATAAISLAGGLILLLFRAEISHFLFGDSQYEFLVALLALLVFIRSLNVQGLAFLKARRHITFMTGTNILYFMAVAFFTSIAAFSTHDIGKVVLAFLLSAFALFLLHARHFLKIGIRLVKPNFAAFWPLAAFSAPLLLAHGSYWVVQVSDRYLINGFLGIREVGVYAANYGIAFVIGAFWLAITSIMLADFSSLFDKGHKEELELRFAKGLKYGMAISVGGIVGFVALREPLVSELTSAAFTGGPLLLPLLGVAMTLFGVFLHLSTLLSVAQKVKLLNLLWLGMGGINIILNLVLIPLFGIEGAALATAVTFALGTLAIVFAVRTSFTLSFSFSWIWKMIVAVMLMGFAISFIEFSSVFGLFSTVFLGMLVYGALLALLRFPSQEELFVLGRFFQRIPGK